MQHVIQQRESFLREIAATKTHARRLIWFGFALSLLGGGTYFVVFANTARQISDFISSVPTDPDVFVEPTPPKIFGDDVGGIPLPLMGIGVAAIGVVLMLVGLVLHVVAASRRKRLETAAVLWQTGSPPSHWPLSTP